MFLSAFVSSLAGLSKKLLNLFPLNLEGWAMTKEDVEVKMSVLILELFEHYEIYQHF